MNTTTRRTIAAAAVSTTLIGGGAVALAASSDASPGTVRTASSNLTVRSGPGTGYQAVGSLRKGTKVNIRCQTYGSTVRGTFGTSRVWNKLGSGRWISDAYTYTGKDGFVAPRCKSGGGTNPAPSGLGTKYVPKVNPYGPGRGNPSAGVLSKRMQFVKKELLKAYPSLNCPVSGPREGVSEHNTGNAVDCAPGSFGVWPNEKQKRVGYQASRWLKTHAKRLQVQYVIWDDKIWNIDRASEGWRDQGKTGVTYAHHDHIHITVRNNLD